MTYANNSSYATNSGNSRIGANYGKGGKSPLPKPYDFKGAMKNLLDYESRMPIQNYALERSQLTYNRQIPSSLELDLRSICPLCNQPIKRAA